jgi:recombination protein RecA
MSCTDVPFLQKPPQEKRNNIMGKGSEERLAKAGRASDAMSSESMDRSAKLAAIKKLTTSKNTAADRQVIFTVPDNPEYGHAGRLPSTIMSFDILTGGGFPRGRVTQIAGPESSGKTTICLKAIGECIRNGGTALYIDAEHSGDSTWMKVNGIDVDDPGFVIATPTTSEEGLELILEAATKGIFDIVVLDSVVALATVAEKGRKITDETIALIARKLSQFFRMSMAQISRSKMALVMVNQVRTSIDTYGAPQRAPGGNALAHAKSLDIGVRRGTISGDHNKRFRDNKRVELGFPMFFKVVKSKISSAFDNTAVSKGSEASVDFYYGSGFDHASDIINLAVRYDILSAGGGGNFAFPEDIADGQKVRGKDSLIELVTGDTTIYNALVQAVWTHLNIEVPQEAEVEEHEREPV